MSGDAGSTDGFPEIGRLSIRSSSSLERERETKANMNHKKISSEDFEIVTTLGTGSLLHRSRILKSLSILLLLYPLRWVWIDIKYWNILTFPIRYIWEGIPGTIQKGEEVFGIKEIGQRIDREIKTGIYIPLCLYLY